MLFQTNAPEYDKLFFNKLILGFGIKKNLLLTDRKESLTVWALYPYFSDSHNAAFELLVWCMQYQCNR